MVADLANTLVRTFWETMSQNYPAKPFLDSQTLEIMCNNKVLWFYNANFWDNLLPQNSSIKVVIQQSYQNSKRKYLYHTE